MRVIILKSVGKDFLIGWQDQVRLGTLHEDWPNIPDAVHIKVQPDAIPYQVSVARPIPYHWIYAAKKVRQEAVEAGIVSRVKEAVE